MNARNLTNTQWSNALVAGSLGCGNHVEMMTWGMQLTQESNSNTWTMQSVLLSNGGL